MRQFIKDLFLTIFHFLEHDEHYIILTLSGKEIRACARCLGKYVGMFIALPSVLILAYPNGVNLLKIAFITASERFGFWEVFLVFWVLAGFAIADWSLIKLKIWHGDNNVRFFSGLTLGAGQVIYIFLLPLPMYVNVLTLTSYWVVLSIARYVTFCKEYHLSLRNPVRQNVAVICASMPLTTVQAGICTQTGGICDCCALPCGDICSCFCNPCCCCVGVIPIVLLMRSSFNRMEKR